MKRSTFIVLVFACCTVLFCAQAQDHTPSKVEVTVGGPVQHPGKYQINTPATIEQALASAGGWSGAGELGIPAKFCLLSQHIDGKLVSTHVGVHIDRKTGKITVLDQAWKEYHLVDGDRLSLAEVYL